MMALVGVLKSTGVFTWAAERLVTRYMDEPPRGLDRKFNGWCVRDRSWRALPPATCDLRVGRVPT